MFDVNLNKIEHDALYQLLESDTPGSRAEAIEMVENLLEIRFNRGKQLGKAIFTDAIVDSIVYELKTMRGR